jgi:dTDP-4-amino-4,6-dideoxygalactose transaminase
VSELLFTDMEKVRSTRKKHYQRYLEQLKGVEGLTVMYEQIENITPHSFPLVIHGGLREKLYFSLFDLNVPSIALYYRLISNIDPDVYADSYSISRSILNLPLHQDLDDEQIDYICTSVKQKLRELRV